MSSQILRPYQQEAVCTILEHLFWYNRVLYTMATGCGKTTTFAELIARFLAEQKRVLVLAHRVELITQAYQRIKEHCKLSEWEIGVELAQTHAATSNRVVVGSIQTVCRPNRLADFKFDVIITDECFPAGTLIDGKPIETLRVGDYVSCFNHAAERIEKRRITRLFKKPAHSLVRVTLANGKQIICTPEHPFYTISDEGITGQWMRRKYTPACRLTRKHEVYCIIEPQGGTTGAEPKKTHKTEEVRCLRERISTAQLEQSDDADMFRKVQSSSSNRATKNSSDELSHLRSRSRVQRQERLQQFRGCAQGTAILLRELPGYVCCAGSRGGYAESEQTLCLRAHEEKQSDEQSCQCRENADFSEGTHLLSARRQRAINQTADCTLASVGIADGICYRVQSGQREIRERTGQFQGRYSRAVLQTGYRGRRPISPTQKVEVSGQAQNPYIERVRVERVEVLESGSGCRFNGLCPDGFIYNIEVEGNHNYFASETLVHNCHRSAAPTYTRTFERFGVLRGECLHVGCTATAKRTDRQSLYACHKDGSPVLLQDKKTKKPIEADPKQCVYEIHCYEYSLLDAVEDGWLVPIRGHVVHTATDISAVEMDKDGDFKEGQLAKAVDTEERTLLAVNAWKEIASERPTLVFCASVEHAKHAASVWRAAGFTAEELNGETDGTKRFETLNAFRQRRLQVLCNMGLFTEGTDLPTCACIVHMRPTKSWNLFVQMTGRGTRALPGVLDGLTDAEERQTAIAVSAKPDCVVIDLVDICEKHELCSVPSILDLPADLDLQGQSVTEAKKMLRDFEDVRESAIADYMPGTFSELKVALEEVNLLRHSEAKSKKKWLYSPDGYLYNQAPPGYCARLMDAGNKEYALIVKYRGQELYKKRGKPGYEFKSYIDGAAEKTIAVIEAHRQTLPPVSRGTLLRLTTKQVNCLKVNGHRPQEIDCMPYAKAKALIETYMTRWKARQEGRQDD